VSVQSFLSRLEGSVVIKFTSFLTVKDHEGIGFHMLSFIDSLS